MFSFWVLVLFWIEVVFLCLYRFLFWWADFNIYEDLHLKSLWVCRVSGLFLFRTGCHFYKLYSGRSGCCYFQLFSDIIWGYFSIFNSIFLDVFWIPCDDVDGVELGRGSSSLIVIATTDSSWDVEWSVAGIPLSNSFPSGVLLFFFLNGFILILDSGPVLNRCSLSCFVLGSILVNWTNFKNSALIEFWFQFATRAKKWLSSSDTFAITLSLS